MSGLDKIIAEIQNDANKAAQLQLEEAQKLADSVIKETEELIAKNKAECEKSALANKEDILERAKSAAELESRKILLKTKQELIESTIKEAMEKLSTLPVDEYCDVLLKLVKKYEGGEKAVMALSKNDIDRMPKDFASKLPSNISIGKDPADIQNGFLLILEGIDINCSFEALFNDKLEELQDKVASILFK